MGWIEDERLSERAVLAGVGIFENVISDFLIENRNGTVSWNGTSSVASLSGDVDSVVSFIECRFCALIFDRW